MEPLDKPNNDGNRHKTDILKNLLACTMMRQLGGVFMTRGLVSPCPTLAGTMGRLPVTVSWPSMVCLAPGHYHSYSVYQIPLLIRSAINISPPCPQLTASVSDDAHTRC